jgi:hypothetical protein
LWSCYIFQSWPCFYPTLIMWKLDTQIQYTQFYDLYQFNGIHHVVFDQLYKQTPFRLIKFLFNSTYFDWVGPVAQSV